MSRVLSNLPVIQCSRRAFFISPIYTCRLCSWPLVQRSKRPSNRHCHFSVIIMLASPKIGFEWANRIIALLSAALLIVANLLIRTRLPLNKEEGASISFRSLADTKYALTTVAVWFVKLANFIPMTYLIVRLVCRHRPVYGICTDSNAKRRYHRGPLRSRADCRLLRPI